MLIIIQVVHSVGNNKVIIEYAYDIVLYTTTIRAQASKCTFRLLCVHPPYNLMDGSESDVEDKIINSYWRDVPDSGRKNGKT